MLTAQHENQSRAHHRSNAQKILDIILGGNCYGEWSELTANAEAGLFV